MDSDQAVEVVQQALIQVLLLSTPVLLVGLVVGLLVGLIQSVTQIQDHTLGFVPKLIVILLVVCFGLPWLFEKLSDYGRQTYQAIPSQFSESEP